MQEETYVCKKILTLNAFSITFSMTMPIFTSLNEN